ncbi:MAG: PRC-barrel domain-containing protein, partial [Bacteroidota bacterium]|nr:PRC-barrel domain-containing protein [Bacteroidota bacterium]
LLTPDWKNEIFPVNLTKEKIKNSPDIDTEQAVSRQHEIEMYEYYPWANYWGGGILAGGMGISGMMTQVRKPLVEAVKRENNADNKDADGDPHLRSSHKVTGYTIRATDGKIGDVEDFIVDDTSWKLDYLVVDTGHWFPGKKVLISPKLVKTIEWETSEIIINVSETAVKNSPEYEPGKAVTESYKADLQNYYGNLVQDIY